MKYISAKAFAQAHNISVRWVQELCRSGKIPGATRLGGNTTWMIPVDASISSNNSEWANSGGSNLKEVISMVNAEKQMETGQMLLNKFDLDMAAVYFEFAGEEFVRRMDYQNALIAYEKTLYCFETDSNLSRAEEIKGIIANIKKKMEEN